MLPTWYRSITIETIAMLFAYCTSLHGGKLMESKAGKPGKLMMESWKADDGKPESLESPKAGKPESGNLEISSPTIRPAGQASQLSSGCSVKSGQKFCISARKIKRTSTFFLVVFTCYPGKHKKLALVLQQQSTYLYLVIYIHRIDVAPSDDKEEEGTKI